MREGYRDRDRNMDIEKDMEMERAREKNREGGRSERYLKFSYFFLRASRNPQRTGEVRSVVQEWYTLRSSQRKAGVYFTLTADLRCKCRP